MGAAPFLLRAASARAFFEDLLFAALLLLSLSRFRVAELGLGACTGYTVAGTAAWTIELLETPMFNTCASFPF